MSDKSCPCPCGKTDGKSCSATTTGQNGKGDAPRNISLRFRKNYDSIRWQSSDKKKKPSGKKFVKVY